MKPENRFIAKVHKALPDYVYAEKTANPYRGGTPDCMYEGEKGYHWIEYKWLPKKPVVTFTAGVTALQLKWLERAYKNQREPWVVVGFPGGCYILKNPTHWDMSVNVMWVDVCTVPQLALLIEERVS